MAKEALSVRRLRGGPFSAYEVETILSKESFDVIQVEGQHYNESLFLLNAQIAYCKSVIYSAEASVAVGSRELIWAAIAAYYALFHLSVVLIYLLPSKIGEDWRRRLVLEWAEGSNDPTRLIQHKDVPGFLKIFEQNGLTNRLRRTLQKAKEIRNHVNYGPRTYWKDDRAVFKVSEHGGTGIIELIVTYVPSLISMAVKWASRSTNFSWVRAVAVIGTLNQFLTNPELLYVEWCSPKVLREARRLAKRLPKQAQLRKKNPASRST